MSAVSGSRDVNTNLVLSVTMDSKHSVRKRTEVGSHGLTNWIAMQAGSVSYVCVYPNTKIFQVDTSGNRTIMVNANEPESGEFTTVGGYTYYGNKPVYLFDGGLQHRMAPTTLVGTRFGNYSSRYDDGIYYSPYGNASVNFHVNETGGGTGNVTTTIQANVGVVTTYTLDSVPDPQTVFVESDLPIVMSVSEENAGDRMVLSPMDQQIYIGRGSTDRTWANTTPSDISGWEISDDTYEVFAVELGDGAGGDGAGHRRYQDLSDTYGYGQPMGEFRIVAPNPDTVVEVFHWNGSAWVRDETITLAGGTIGSPVETFRDGNTGFGSTGNAAFDDGTATNFASGADIWLFEGSAPFLLRMNDTSSDEENILGWNRSDITRREDHTERTIRNAVNLPASGIITGYTDFANTISFNGSTSINMPYDSSYDFALEQTVELWIQPSSLARRNPYSQAYGGAGTITHEANGSLTYHYGIDGGDSGTFSFVTSSFTVAADEIACVHVTRDENNIRWYKNGVHETVAANAYGNTVVSGTNAITIGSGNAASYHVFSVKAYTSALSNAQVRRNFISQRKRFGL